MDDAPVSYQDPYWAQLAGSVETKLGLPTGLLQSVITRGERSNNDQVSEDGARTVAQIIPATRTAAIDKYGIDPYLNAPNAVMVAGRLLKDSLDRNQGDARAAVSEYHGGTDPANWGPRTRAYVGRVMAGQQQVQNNAMGSDFAAFMAANPAVPPSAMAPGMTAPGNIDLNNRPLVKNPDGTTSTVRSIGANVDGQEVLLPTVSDDGRVMSNDEAIAQYRNTGKHLGKFSTPQASDAYAQQVHADQAQRYGLDPLSQDFGAWHAQQIAPPNGADGVPAAPTHPDAPMSASDAVVGGGEAALNAVTGMAAGYPAGLISEVSDYSKGISNWLAHKLGVGGPDVPVGDPDANAQAAAQAFTYQPRTAAGQQLAQSFNQFLSDNMTPLAGMAPELAAIHAATPPALRAVADRVSATAAEGPEVAARLAQGVQDAAAKLGLSDAAANDASATPTPGTMGSAGAAATDAATQRVATAQSMPVPVQLTTGQATRDFAQQRFERETAKDPSVGAPLRERYAQQNQDVLRNFDAFVDQTGAEAPTLRATGEAVDTALRSQMQADKNAVRVAYKKAADAGELEEPVSLEAAVQHLNDQAPAATTAPVLDAAKKFALKLGVATEDDAGNLVPQPVALATAEQFRKAINRATNYEPTNVYQATQLRSAIDGATEGLGGNLYRQARATRARFAQNYENRATIAKLLDTPRGTTDRAVALEDVFQHTILNSSKDDVANVRRVLQRAGPGGWQAWRELQGATMRYIRDEATKNVATDVRGNPIISAARLNQVVRGLDHDGKLDFIFGKKGGQQVRDIAELSKDLYTSPPGSVNSSNTASVLLAALTEAGVTGSLTGLPVPVLSGLRLVAKHVSNRRIQHRVTDALNAKQAARP